MIFFSGGAPRGGRPRRRGLRGNARRESAPRVELAGWRGAWSWALSIGLGRAVYGGAYAGATAARGRCAPRVAEGRPRRRAAARDGGACTRAPGFRFLDSLLAVVSYPMLQKASVLNNNAACHPDRDNHGAPLA